MTLYEVNEAAAIIRESADKDVNLIFGAVIDPSLQDQIRITVVATGYPDAEDVMNIRQPEKTGIAQPRQIPQQMRQVYREPVPETSYASPMKDPEEVQSSPAPMFGGRSKKEKLDIPPFLKMKSRD